MVRAVLAGTKTQTRRLLKVPNFEHWYPEDHYIVDESGTTHPGVMERRHLGPFGEPDGTLWVREAFYCDHAFAGRYEDVGAVTPQHKDAATFEAEWRALTYYRADYGDRGPDFEGARVRWTPSIHMPRWASRVTLDIESIRVERLQDITEEDAKAEGVESVAAFHELWASIYGPGSWDENPLVWVCDFK